MVNDLAESVRFLTTKVETLIPAQVECPAAHSPPATSNLPALLKDLSSRVAALSTLNATQVPLSPHQSPPPPTPLLPKPTHLSRKRNLLPFSPVVPSPLRTLIFFSRGCHLVIRPCSTSTTWTLPNLVSAVPLATPSPGQPNYTVSPTQPPCSSRLDPQPGSLSLIPHSLKSPPGHRLPGRVARARKPPLHHKSLCQPRVVSSQDPQRAQLHNVVS